jgi:phage repressor protein C with HTH and peptisase S24 domain
MQHGRIWQAIDALAARRGLSPSGLARAAGLDPTTFNRSKRQSPEGRERWPSTESVARALAAAQTGWDEFAALLAGRAGGSGRAVPILAMTRAGGEGMFDAHGFPVAADETVRFPDLGDARVYALEIAGDAAAPVFRSGDIVIVEPGAAVRRGDRVVARTRSGEVLAMMLGRRNEQSVEFISLNPEYPARTMAAAELDWIARVVWASQ